MFDEITRHLPRQFVLDVLDNTDAAFLGAKRIVDDMVGCEEPERAQMLGHHRHWGQEEGVRQAARSSGLRTAAPHTSPRGGRFSLVEAGDLVLARTKITTVGTALRPSKYMRGLALHNRYLEPSQWDLFLEELEISTDTTFCLIVTVAPKKRQDESRPSYVGIGVPTPDLTGWHFRDSLENLLAAYPSIGVEEIPDRAVPTLKKRCDKKADDSGSSA